MKKITLFEIRLDQNVVVLRGDPTEAPAAQLTGKIVLVCTDSIPVKSLSIKLECRQSVTDTFNGPWGTSTRLIKHDTVIFSGRKVPIGEKTTLPAGNHEFPFQWLLYGNAPESVEGFGEASILWNLNAHLERNLIFSDLHAHKHVRIVRTLPNTALEFSQTMSVSNTWIDKVDYSISTPSKAVIFGSNIPIEARLTPLLKGVRIHKIMVTLIESYDLSPQGKDVHRTRNILDVEWPGFEDPPSDEDDGAWVLNEKVFLPQTLAKCLQDCEVGRIKIRHKLRFAIQLRNPDGHISELRATLPIMIFISQHYLVNEQNEVPEITSQVTAESEVAAPPRYEQHQLDELYEGVDLDMYLSQANSPVVLSRSGSAENLQLHSAGLTPLTSTSGTSSPVFTHDASTSRSSNASTGLVSGHPSLLTPHGHADLVARLQRAHQRPEGSSGSLNALANSTSWTNPSSGRESPNPDSPAEPHDSSLSSSPGAALYMANISRVPSYHTAILTPTRNLSFESSPAYERVASGPPSRITSSNSLLEMAMRPNLSRSSSSSGHSGTGHNSPEEQHNPDAFMHIDQTPRIRGSRAPKLFSSRWRG